MFQEIKNALVGLAEWLLDLVKALIKALWDFAVDVVCYVFDKLLDFATGLLNALDVSALSVDGWGQLPGDVANILGLIGLGDAMAIISAAIIIRLTLQLIPFTRLGS